MASVNLKSGPFSFAICIGDFFDQDKGIEELLSGKIQIPLECYVTRGQQSLSDRVIDRITEKAGEICDNLFFIGRSNETLQKTIESGTPLLDETS